MTQLELWSKAILPINATIEQAIQVLNDVALKIVLITDDKGIFLGTISDGDIRRGLLKGLHFLSSIESVIHREALTVTSDLPRDQVVKLMTAYKVQQIPIIDERKLLTGLHVWDEVAPTSVRSNIMIIMAGGKGTRLYPQTIECPKPLVKIAGKPILQHTLERAKAEGISHFILAIHYLGHMIEDYFGNGEKFGVRIEYLRELTPLGTAGALSLLESPPTSVFLVTNGDVITGVRYGEILDFHDRQGAMGTMAVHLHEYQNPFGVVQIEGFEISGYEEKPIHQSYINAGVYALNPDCLKLLKKAEHCDMPELFEKMRKNSNRIVAYPIHEHWLDIGRPDDLQKAISETQKRNGHS